MSYLMTPHCITEKPGDLAWLALTWLHGHGDLSPGFLVCSAVRLAKRLHAKATTVVGVSSGSVCFFQSLKKKLLIIF